MISLLVLSSIVIISAIFTNKFLSALGIPALLSFLFLGVVFGSNEIFRIDYSDFLQAKDISSLALGFIIFFGGFCTKWAKVKVIALKAIILSTLGVLLTAIIVAIFCNTVLNLSALESFLIGSVIGSTDAASVFSILKSKRLFLKENTGELLELESGSNDPMSYILVILAITLMQGESVSFVSSLFFKQVFGGILIGVLFAKISKYIFQKTEILTDGNENLFLIAILLLVYALGDYYNANPYLALYFLGIILGNSKIDNKNIILNFFDGITKLAQIGIFFLLGLLASLSELKSITSSGFTIFLFLTFVARPITVFFLLKFFHSSIEQKLLISWGGLRGVASIVFAIIAMNSNIQLEYNLFHLVFLITVLSLALQGSFLPLASKLTGMIETKVDIKKSFNDFQEECAIKFMHLTVPHNHTWVNKRIRDITFPNNSVVYIIKRDNTKIMPKNSTKILGGDKLTLAVVGEG